jgi:hypothetical protein
MLERANVMELYYKDMTVMDKMIECKKRELEGREEQK